MVIERGGKSEERLYLHPARFDCKDEIIIIMPTDMPNMEEITARHRARYHYVNAFCRPQYKILDFPCGSGYGSEILCPRNYEGRDNDEATIQYAKFYYKGIFEVDDLTEPHLEDRTYDIIACIEGLEHIEQKYQNKLIKHFCDALMNNGFLIITSPERKGEITNPYHKWELKRNEFEDLLKEQFGDVQILCVKEENHRKEKTNFMYGICRKED